MNTNETRMDNTTSGVAVMNSLVQQPPRGWWSRNWKWFVPVSCLTGVLGMVAVCGGLMLALFGVMKSSWAYTEGLDLARHNKAVVAKLGEPIEGGRMVSGSVNVSGSSGHANLAIPLSGPRGSGVLYVVAHKVADKWRWASAEVEITGAGQRIDLLEKQE
jgi:hypothetical protein